MQRYCTIVVLATMFVIYNNVFAQTSKTDSSGQISEIQKTHHDKNHFALFSGVTSQLEKKGNDFSLGIDYVRVLSESGLWAGSIFTEAIFAEHTEWLFGVVIFRRLGNAFWVRTGPGIEIIQEESHDSHDHQTKSKVEFLYRIGCGYPFHTDLLTITPSIDLDLVRSATALVWGINIGKSF